MQTRSGKTLQNRVSPDEQQRVGFQRFSMIYLLKFDLNRINSKRIFKK